MMPNTAQDHTQTTRRGRRRVLRMMAAAGAAMVLPGAALGGVHRREWRGTALGADASITLFDADPERAERLIGECVALTERLEAVFSLHRPDSALSDLNRSRSLDPAPRDLVDLLDQSGRLHDITGGAFDPTIQPLWSLYADHFGAGGSSAGPSDDAISAALARVGFGGVRLDGRSVVLKRPGMALTLNGIAQGYITDRVADHLRAAGLRHVLVDMGETRALGAKPDGAPWRIGIADPTAPFKLLRRIPLAGGAVATSSGGAAPFDAAGAHHHLIDPRTGRSPEARRTVAVLADSAALADGLSTALAVMDRRAMPDALRAAGPARALIWSGTGKAEALGA